MVHFRYIGMVTSDDKKRFTIGRKLDTVRTMFSPAIHHFERNNGIQLVISIGVKKSIQSTLYSKLIFFGIMSGMIVHHDIEAVKSRSEEHTSELQSRGHLVCRLLLEKKK